MSGLEAGLAVLSVKELKKRARVLGADEQNIDDLDDADDVKAAAVSFVVKLTEIQTTLTDLSVKELKKRARTLGAEPGAIDDLDDADDIRGAAIVLVTATMLRIPDGTPAKPEIAEPQPEEKPTAAPPSSEKMIEWEDKGLLKQGGSHSVKKFVNLISMKEVAGKVHGEEESFRTELANLQRMARDMRSKRFVMQLEGVDEGSRTLFLELATGSLDELFSTHPHGFGELDTKAWLKKILQILAYLHETHEVAHNDLKVENLLVFQSGIQQQLKIGDLDSCQAFGEPQAKEATPYICSPELAQHIRGQLDSLIVSEKTDIWALGVTALYLKTGKMPFTVADAEDLPPKLASLATLRQHDIEATLAKAGIKQGEQFHSFLRSCLEIEPNQRATARKLLSSGYITGDSATQVVRATGGALMRIESGQHEIIEQLDAIQAHLANVTKGIEVVRQTIINMDASTVPLIFVIEADVSERNVDTRLGCFARIFDTNSRLQNVKEAIDELQPRTMTLKLVCQYTWEPVGDGYTIQQARETVPKLLPLMTAGLRGVKAVNGVSKLARMFGFNTPDMGAAVEKVQSLCDQVTDSNQFQCVAEATGADLSDPTELSRFQCHEFERFLAEHDKQEAWKGLLQRVVLTTGEVLWVSELGYGLLEQEGHVESAALVKTTAPVPAPTKALKPVPCSV